MIDERSSPVVLFGEVLARLAAPIGSRLANVSSFSVHVGGAEANVAAFLAQLGHSVEMVTVLPQSPLGDLCEGELRRVGIGTREVARGDGRLGLYFFEPGTGPGGRVVYDREFSAFAKNADRIDWQRLASTARWFHLSGINLALGDRASTTAIAAAEAMRAAGVPISFDVNHRASLWEGKSEAEFARVRTLAGLADLLFASAQDIGRLLETDVPPDPAAAASAAFGHFRQLRWLASTSRSGDRLSARIDTRETHHETTEASLGQVVDRIGSGDAFAGGVINGLLRNLTLEQCASEGLAAAVMKHSIAGDRWIGTRAELEAFDPFAVGDVRR